MEVRKWVGATAHGCQHGRASGSALMIRTNFLGDYYLT
jgi:hypothetical protein